ncbi:MAG: glucose-1-phosphate adenylyltransferase [Candidatus Latescibacterota bacterium]|nr:MAG: glucose-1-phosphate adenylyltransferase [Candidatus Latescibacterota bacterium]
MSTTDVFVLVGGQGSRLSVLSEHRAKPAVPFAGKYRIIDFTLTNCVYSGFFRIHMLTQYRPRSLVEHVGVGKPWDLDRKWGGLAFLHPYVGHEGSAWYGGTADALVQNLDVLRDSRTDDALILSGDHVYKMNYEWLVRAHRETDADVTVCVIEVPWDKTHEFGILTADEQGRIVEFAEKPAQANSNLASMGVYVFKRKALIRILEELQSEHPNLDFGHHVIPAMMERGHVMSYRYGGYWLDIGTVQSYYDASMELLLPEPRLNLFDNEWHILTREHNRPPTCIEDSAHVHDSMITDGCEISGAVSGSILGPGVVVEEGARVEHSVLLDDCLVRRGALVQRCILDKRVKVGSKARIGVAGDGRINEEQPKVLQSGITVVGKDARIPAHQVIGTNCLIDMLTSPDDFHHRKLPDGTSLRTNRAHHTVR